MKNLKVITILLACMIFNFLYASTIRPNVKNICYSPFRKGQSPTGKSPSRDEIVEDLVNIKTIFPNATIRTFGIDKDYLQIIPEVCESLAIDYIISGWTSFLYSNTWESARQDINSFLNKTDSLGYTHLKGIIYGYNNINDVSTLSEKQKVDHLVSEINKTKALIDSSVELGHEENWDVFIREPRLAADLNVLSLRIIPQDDLVSIDSAFNYVLECYNAVSEIFPDKKILVSSTGWSTYGSCEEDQKKFIDAITSDTTMESFLHSYRDESWKVGIEKCFGLYTEQDYGKKFLRDSLHIDYSNIMKGDSNSLGAISYYYSSFNYSPNITITALQKSIKGWADSLKSYADFVILDREDLYKVNGELINIFSENSVCLNLESINEADTAIICKENVKGAMFNFSSEFNYYGRQDSVGKKSYLDMIYHKYVSPFKTYNQSDSVFLAASIGIDHRFVDTLCFYPEILDFMDGLVLTTYLSEFRNAMNVEATLDSIFQRCVTAIGDKKLIVLMNIFPLDFTIDDDEVVIYEAFLKMKEKYKFSLAFSHIGHFYESDQKTPNARYRNLMPWKFDVATIEGINENRTSKLFWHGNNLVIKSNSTVELSIFDLRGRQQRKLFLEEKSNRVNLKKLNLTNGTYIFRIKNYNNKIFYLKKTIQ